MYKSKHLGVLFAGTAAGIINGIFGAGGGMVLIPLLSAITDITESALFPSSVAMILPMCVLSLFFTSFLNPIPWTTAFPYLLGSALGGLLAGIFGKKIPAVCLHRGLGCLILLGGIRCLY